MTDRLAHTRVLVTQADQYMGPAICELFAAEGATVIADRSPLNADGACERVVASAGEIDVLIANLAHAPKPSVVQEIADSDWFSFFDALVHPLMRLVRAVTPAMIARRHGKIVAITSAAPLRGIPKASAYSAARGAQNAFVRAAGAELAASNVQFNAVAQNYIHNDTYYPRALIDSDRFQQHLKRNVPAGRIGEGWESAELALFLASDKSDFLCGQAIPLAGGWA
jgi:2-keto-3-deoxy-L-fuconate dehydrogenase